MNLLFQNALKRIPQEIPPIWFMRQAGRYHSHYQGLRAQHSFEQLCKQSELAAQVALGPVQDFDYDVSILFSDILFPLEGLGFGLEYTDHGPRLGFHLTAANFQNLRETAEAIEFMSFQKKAVQATRELLPKNKSLIGFVGGPWTLFVYAVEGSHAGSLIKSKSNLELLQKFLDKIYVLLKANIQLQLDGGAEIVMIFDTAAGEVSPAFFQKQLQPILTKLSKDFPDRIGYYSKGTQHSFFDHHFRGLPWAGLGVDHRWHLPEAFSILPRGFVQGNFDQALLFQEESTFKKSLERYLQGIKEIPLEQRAGWVSGLGHGVLPQTPEKHVKYFVNRVREVFG